MNSIHKLAEFFAEFPGIGPRQSKRFVYFLLTRNNGFLEEFSKLILKLKQEINVCSSCFRFFPKNHSDSKKCNTCNNKNRDISSLMVISRDVDFENIEKTHFYNGLYFILGGSIPILEKEPETKIRQKELLNRVEKAEGLKEIILATNLNPEGENTAEYIEKILIPLVQSKGFKISHLGKGLSTGTELEYSDTDTIKNALKNRN